MAHLRRRILLLLSLVAVAFFSAIWWIQQHQLLPSFLALERQHALADLDRGVEALRNEVGFVSDYVSDWAGWDDTYEFVVDRNAEFEKSNLETDVFRESSFDFLAIVALDGNEIWRGCQVGETKVTIEELPTGTWPATHELLQAKAIEDVCTGIVVTAHGPLMIACRPISDSAREKEPRGWILMGRFLSSPRLQKLGKQTRLDLRLAPIAVGGGVVRQEAVALATAGITLAADDDQLVARTLVPGLHGERDTLLLEVVLPRQILLQGQNTLAFALSTTTFAVLLLFAVLAGLLQHVVIGPLQRLTQHALGIRASGDMLRRSGIDRKDEIGTLAREFDGMVERLAVLQSAQVQQARVGGMAEVARTVLHDVGNALQPVAGNVGVLQQRLGQPHVQDLERVVDMMAAHAQDLGEWLSNDPKGQKVPTFLRALADGMKAEKAAVQQEIAHLGQGLEHIRSLVDRQQTNANSDGAREAVRLPDLLAEAVRMSVIGDAQDRLQPVVEVAADAVVTTEKHRLLAVLINLLRNARHAVQGRTGGSVRVAVTHPVAGSVRISVRDDGVGISNANLTKIFHAGFSTRSGGQGLGLHGCANSITEMGGRLWAESEGEGRGATFHVELPAAIEAPVAAQ